MKTLFYPVTYNNRELIIRKDLMLSEFSDCIYATKPDIKLFLDKVAQTLDIKSIHISSDYGTELEKCERIVLLPGLSTSEIIDAVNKACKKGKDILVASSLLNSFKEFANIAEIRRFPFNDIEYKKERPVLYDINIPIISIMGLGEYCEKFSCELLARQYFTSLGYKVLQYGSKEISEMYGFNRLPSYIFDDCLTASARSIQFNHDVAKAASKEYPDLIIVGTSGGIMPIEKTYLNDFGQGPQIISNALDVDYTILGVHYQEHYSKEFIEQLSGTLKYKFGTELSAICVSNTASEINYEQGGTEMKYFHLDAFDINRLSYTVDADVKNFSINQSKIIEEALENICELMTCNISTL